MAGSLLYLLLRRVLSLFRADHRAVAEAELEIAVLRHQVAILRRQVNRPVYRASDRAFLAAASRMLRRESWGAFLVRPRDPPPVAPAACGQEVDQAAPPSRKARS